MKTAFAADEAVVGATTGEIAKIVESIITKIPLFLAGFVLIIVSIFIAKIVKTVVINKLAERGIEEEHKELQILSGRIAYVTIMVLGITSGLKIAGIDITTIIAAAAFGVGFALRDIIMNFLAGIMILISRHFTIGDFIKVGSVLGKIEEIQSRVTIIKALNGTKVIVPNATLFKKNVISLSSNPLRRFDLFITIDYRNNLQNALKVTLNAVKNTKGVLSSPAPSTVVKDFGDNGVKLKVKAWCEIKSGWIKVRSRTAENIKSDYIKYGIVIPWPIRTIVQDKNEIKENILEESPVTPAQQNPPLEAMPQVAIQSGLAPIPVAEQEDYEKPLKPLGEN